MKNQSPPQSGSTAKFWKGLNSCVKIELQGVVGLHQEKIVVQFSEYIKAVLLLELCDGHVWLGPSSGRKHPNTERNHCCFPGSNPTQELRRGLSIP